MTSTALARIGRWEIFTAPNDWLFLPDFGLRHNTAGPASNIHLQNDVLLAGDRLSPYVEAQKTMLSRTYDTPAFAGPQPSRLLAGKVDEAMLLLVQHQTMHGTTVLQMQTYVRVREWIGVITLTTVDTVVRRVQPDYDSFAESLGIASEP